MIERRFEDQGAVVLAFNEMHLFPDIRARLIHLPLVRFALFRADEALQRWHLAPATLDVLVETGPGFLILDRQVHDATVHPEHTITMDAGRVRFLSRHSKDHALWENRTAHGIRERAHQSGVIAVDVHSVIVLVPDHGIARLPRAKACDQSRLPHRIWVSDEVIHDQYLAHGYLGTKVTVGGASV